MTPPRARAELLAAILNGLRAYAPDEVETYGHDEAEMIADHVEPYLTAAVAAEREACLAAAEAADCGGPECFLCGCKARAVEAITARRGPA